jgi:hypothetical protein
LFVSPGSVRLDNLQGDGILVAGGDVELAGETTFSGVIVAAGALRSDPSSRAAVNGAALGGGALQFSGAGAIRYDRAVLDRVGTEYAGLLPHGVRVAGWREWPEAGPR